MHAPGMSSASGAGSGSDVEEKTETKVLRVGLPGGTVHEFSIDVSEPVSSVVSYVLDAEGLDPNAVRVRIISSGKLVRNHAAPLRDVLNEGCFLHAAISDAPPAEPEQGGILEGEHNGVSGEESQRDGEGSLMLSAVDMNGEVRIIMPNFTPGGFESLAQAGFSEEEIRMIRRQFRRMRREARERIIENHEVEEEWYRVPSDGSVQVEETGDEETGRVRLRREPRFVLTNGAEGTNGDFLMGCIFGYLLGIIVLVLLLDNNATRRWRVGIVAGVATNCAFGILRTSLYLQGSFAPP